MKKLLMIMLIAPVFLYSRSESKGSSCINCHLSTDWVSDTTIAAVFLAGDIHRDMGLGCQDCHGFLTTCGA